MANPIENSDAQDMLLEFFGPWCGQFDTVQSFQHPAYTCVRLIHGNRDVIISAERVDNRLYVGSCLRANDEDDASWQVNAGYYGRKLFTLEQYILEHCTVELDREKIFKQLNRGIRPDRKDHVKQYLDANRQQIGDFVEYVLNLPTNA